ncbi:hypothetical protein [Kibdelosporangium persicum]|uniref:hypothetical protein n=1 Tax=Kibdelosporangium persicum TaxID=2698649 RepID=UPI001563F897|nr:hypothetical protein [Kibdelosporangium persicum]
MPAPANSAPPPSAPAALLTLALRAADGVAFKYGYVDLPARLIDLMRSAAQLAEDPLLLAAVAYVRTETFFATGHLTPPPAPSNSRRPRTRRWHRLVLGPSCGSSRAAAGI